jgi:hypothetical protein
MTAGKVNSRSAMTTLLAVGAIVAASPVRSPPHEARRPQTGAEQQRGGEDVDGFDDFVKHDRPLSTGEPSRTRIERSPWHPPPSIGIATAVVMFDSTDDQGN